MSLLNGHPRIFFYYPRGDQKQAGLIIEANGAVTQTNTEWRNLHRKAEISGASGTIFKL